MMRYFLLNPENPDKDEHVKVKASSKVFEIVSAMRKLARKHLELDLKLVKELARCNNISEDEASDLMAGYDFLVDSAQYGLTDLVSEISKEEFYGDK